MLTPPRPATRWTPPAAALDRRLADLSTGTSRRDGAGTGTIARGRGAGAAAATRLLARRRSAAYERELPAVLESVAAQLRAGSSLRQAVAGAVPPPSTSALPDHWQRLTEDLAVVGVEVALDRWVEVAGDRSSVRLAAGALALAVATGGSPARAVDGVASTLRARRASAEEVRALAAQARASAGVIAVAPVVFSILAGLGDRRIVDFFLSPLGLVLLGVGLGLDALGAWWMHRLCRVPV